MKTKIGFLFAIAIGVSCFFTGCIALPGQEPFGEHTYSDDRAQSIYDDIHAEMEQSRFSDWNGYSIGIDENMVSCNFYQTEEYTMAWYEGEGKEYLWYQGCLYCYDGELLAYRDMDWEEFQLETCAKQQWDMACTLLAQKDGELTYKYIPMAADNPYLLKADYSETEWDGQIRRFPHLSFCLDENRYVSTFSVRWQDGGDRVITITFYPYENSTDLQAERKIWRFAHELGLIEKGVPALSVQQDDRKWCRSVIASIDFESILDEAEYQDDLTFPVKLPVHSNF